MANNQLNNLFKKFDLTETVAAAKEQISEKAVAFKAHQKKLASIQDLSLAEVVSPLTGKKFGESFELTTSTSGYPQITLFPWLKGEIGYARHGGSAIRAFVDAFGLLRYSTLLWHAHEASFDPTLPRVPEVLSVTQDGVRWQFYSWQNGAYVFAPMNEAHIGLKTAKHRELDMMLMALEYKRPLGIVLFREEWEAEFQAKIQDRLEMKVSDVLVARANDFSSAQVARRLGQGPVANNGSKKPALVGDINLDEVDEPLVLNVFTPRSTKPVVVLFDPSAPNAEDVKNGVRNAAPGMRIEIAK
jgi:hypothetical protein